MNEEDIITYDDFVVWKNNKVTKKIFQAYQELKEMTESQLISPDLIMANNGQLRLAELSGYRNGLNELLNIQAESFVDDNEEEI